MDLVSLEELRQINWIKNSDFISSMTEENEDIVIDRQLIIPDILNDEPLDIVYSSINFFGGEPKNFLDYIRKQTQEDFDKLLIDRPKNEHSYITKLKDFSYLEKHELSKWAAKNGYLEILKYCMSKDYYFDKDICSYSIRSIKCLKYLHEKNFYFTDHTFIYASMKGTLECIKYLFDKSKTFTKDLCFYAAGNDLDCLIYLQSKGFSINIKSLKQICSNAALKGKVDCLKYLHENGCIVNDETCSSAIKGFSAPCLKYIYDVGYKIKKDLFYECLEIDSLDCLKYLHSINLVNYYELDNIYNISSSINCLMFLHENGYTIPNNICEDSVKHNNIETLKYFISFKQVNEETCSLASKNGNLEILMFLHKNNCPWNIETVKMQ